MFGSRKPADTAFKQQRLPSFQPLFTPLCMIISLSLLAAFFLPLGIAILVASKGVQEFSIPYGKECSPETDYLKNYRTWTDATKSCKIVFSLPDNADWSSKEVFLYYQLDNFYQNQRK